jgi:hypothetical protein
MAEHKRERTRMSWGKKVLIGLAAFTVLAGLVSFFDDAAEQPAAKSSTWSVDRAEEATGTNADPKPTPARPPEPATPRQRLVRAVANADIAGERARVEYSPQPLNTAVITWDVRENLTNGLTCSGAKDDALQLLKATHRSGVRLRGAGFRGMYPFTDQYGYPIRGRLLWAWVDRAAMHRVNWSQVDLLDLADFASRYGIHRDCH